jgi:hypothetical protein
LGSPIDQGELPGLSTDVYRRIQVLKDLRDNTPIITTSHIENIEAILTAYRSGQLGVKEGMVSYWAHGKQLSDLKPLDYNDVIKVASQNDADKHCFWLEEVNSIY